MCAGCNATWDWRTDRYFTHNICKNSPPKWCCLLHTTQGSADSLRNCLTGFAMKEALLDSRCEQCIQGECLGAVAVSALTTLSPVFNYGPRSAMSVRWVCSTHWELLAGFVHLTITCHTKNHPFIPPLFLPVHFFFVSTSTSSSPPPPFLLFDFLNLYFQESDDYQTEQVLELQPLKSFSLH